MEQTRQTIYLATKEAYNLWAPVYDIDSNPLQALDDTELASLLPYFLTLLPKPNTKVRIADLGCGTGRNILKLMSVPQLDIVGVDASEKMIEIARNRCQFESIPLNMRANSLAWYDFDILSPDSVPPGGKQFHGIISTLVLEHVPLPAFFSVAASWLISGGHLLVTNMHPEMGAKSQAGFVDPETGGKIRPVSYAHNIAAVIDSACQHNFEMIGEAKETAIEEDMVEKLGPRAVKWIGVKCWFGLVFKKGSKSMTSL